MIQHLKSAKDFSLAVVMILPTIMAHEGKENEPYVDMVGKTTWCYGETEGTPKHHYSDTECLMMLAIRVSEDFEAPIANCTDNWADIPLETRMSAITFAYNVGVNGYCTSSIARNLRNDDIPQACDSMLLWNKGRVNGRLKVIDGLTNRRVLERKLCLEGVHTIA